MRELLVQIATTHKTLFPASNLTQSLNLHHLLRSLLSLTHMHSVTV
jgi:hypothetical protein